jgi:hypothetical protein
MFFCSSSAASASVSVSVSIFFHDFTGTLFLDPDFYYNNNKTKHYILGPRPADLLACRPIRRRAHAKPDILTFHSYISALTHLISLILPEAAREAAGVGIRPLIAYYFKIFRSADTRNFPLIPFTA